MNEFWKKKFVSILRTIKPKLVSDLCSTQLFPSKSIKNINAELILWNCSIVFACFFSIFFLFIPNLFSSLSMDTKTFHVCCLHNLFLSLSFSPCVYTYKYLGLAFQMLLESKKIRLHSVYFLLEKKYLYFKFFVFATSVARISISWKQLMSDQQKSLFFTQKNEKIVKKMKYAT